jgi:hypothetical protein
MYAMHDDDAATANANAAIATAHAMIANANATAATATANAAIAAIANTNDMARLNAATAATATTNANDMAQSRKRSELTPEDAIYIWHCRKTKDKLTASKIAMKYNLTPKAVRDIWLMRTWKVVTKPYWDPADHTAFSTVQSVWRRASGVCEVCVSVLCDNIFRY